MTKDWELVLIQYNVYTFSNKLTEEELPFMADSKTDAFKKLERHLEGYSVPEDCVRFS